MRTAPRLVPVAVLVAAALALAGCGGGDGGKGPALTGPTADAGCGFHSGPFSNAVTVSGDFGGEVTAKFGRPFRPAGLERTIVTAGSGKAAEDGRAVNATVSVFNGRTGDLINRQASKATVGDAAPSSVTSAGISCVPVGSRVVVAAPASELLGAEGSKQLGLAGDDGVVIVTDVAEVVKPPRTEPWPDAPAVIFNGRRSPTLTVPTGTAPDRVLVDVIRPGHGVRVHAGDQVTVNFKTMVWGSGKVVLETYGKGKAPLTYGTNDFVPGFTAALIGQRAGARLLVAVPAEFGFGADGQSAGISPTDTLLIVVEIESAQAR